MNGKDDTPTPTPLLEEPSKPSTDQSDPKTITDRFTVIDKIGSGGMGKVYSALDSRLNRIVAIKILSQDNFSEDQWMRFQREARAASKLSHPNIVQVLDFGQSNNNQPFLIMEYIKGETLADYLKEQGPIPEYEALNIISDLCSAMEHAHSKNIIHRDLKPANIIISGNQKKPRFMILDFGIAKVEEDNKGIKTLTRTGQIVGSPRCMSPEQAIGEKIDERADIYSLGCIAYELLTGIPVFKGNTSFSVIEKHIGTKAPKLSDSNQGTYSDEVESLIAKALEKDPKDRFKSMAEFKRKCLDVQNMHSSQEALFAEGKEESLSSTQILQRSPLAIKYSITIVVALTLAACILLLFNPDSTQNQNKSSPNSASLKSSIAQEAKKGTDADLRMSTKNLENTKKTLPNKAKLKNRENRTLEEAKKGKTYEFLSFTNYEELSDEDFKFAENVVRDSTGYGIADTISLIRQEFPEMLSTKIEEKPKARLVWIKSARIEQKDISTIKKIKNLEYIKLEKCEIAKNALTSYLPRSNLVKLQLLGTPLSEELAESIGNSKSIRSLTLLNVGLNNKKLAKLAKNRELAYLNIKDNPLVSRVGLSYFMPVRNLTIKYNKGSKLLSEKSLDQFRKKHILLIED